MDWQPIETAPDGEHILYFPFEPSKRGGPGGLPEMIKIDRFTVCYPRKPTHWMPLPAPPKHD